MAKKKTKSKRVHKKVSKKAPEIIHVKLEYHEAKAGKQDMLMSQARLIKILKHIQTYRNLRTEELRKKIEIEKRLKSIKASINKLKTILPKYKKPDILLKKEEEEEKELEEIQAKKEFERRNPFTPSLDTQLEEIQRKIKALQEN